MLSWHLIGHGTDTTYVFATREAFAARGWYARVGGRRIAARRIGRGPVAVTITEEDGWTVVARFEARTLSAARAWAESWR